MSLLTASSIELTTSSINLSHLKRKDLDLSGVFQEIFSAFYLQPFQRDPNLKLKEKEFEILDPSICRVTHGAMHAARVAAYVKVLHLFRSKLIAQDQPILEPLLTSGTLDTTQMIHLTQLVGCLHDAARRAEVADRWDKESSSLCESWLKRLFEELDPAWRRCFSSMIEFKDDSASYTSFLRSESWSDEQITAWNYLKELVHDADCLDIMRVKKNFDVQYLDVYRYAQDPSISSSLFELVNQIRELIHKQADLYKDVSILHPSLQAPLLPKNFSIEIKKTYEHAPLVYKKITQDMEQFSWLKA
jgi:hypothetical protein